MGKLGMKNELQRLGELHFDISTQINIFKEKKELLGSKNNEKGIQTVWMMDSWSTVESVESKHEELVTNIKKHQKLDQSIINLYLKILGWQLHKIENQIKKLESIYQKSPADVCPAEYTVQCFQEWTRTNPKIHALQSEIFDLLTKKIRHNRSRTTEESFLEKSKDFELSIEKLRTKTYFFLERDPLVDTNFAVHISNTVCDGVGTFESNKIREFVNSCWEMYESGCSDFDFAFHYQQFVGAITQHLLTKFGHLRRSGSSKLDLTCDQIFGIVESHIIPSIYKCIYKRNVLDETISSQCTVLSKLSQEQIGIKEYFIDECEIPYNEAINHLKLLPLVMLPTQKLRQLILAAQSVMKRMAEVCRKENTVTGADEFMDVWVYVAIQSNIRYLYSNIVYIRDFCNPNYMLSETGYYLSSLELAAQFIRTADESKFKNVEKPSSKCITIATPEKKKLGLLSGVKFIEDISIEGYQFVTSFAWVAESLSFLKYAFIKSETSSNPIQVSLFEVPEKIARKLFPGESETISLQETESYFLPIYENSFDDNTMVIVDSHESFKEFQKNFISYCRLRCLGIEDSFDSGFKCNEFLGVLKSMEKRLGEDFFERLQKFLLSEHIDEGSWDLNKIYSYVVEKLVVLKCYNRSIDQTNVYHFRRAVKKFQESDHEEGLRVDGICDLKTYQAIIHSAYFLETKT